MLWVSGEIHMTYENELDVTALRRNISKGFHRIRFGDISVPIKYLRGTNDTVIIIFHGAFDQSKHQLPRYQSFLPELGACHQISISDPTQKLDPTITTGWYLGGASMPLQAELPSLLQALFHLSGAKKRIYLGGSSGGFAALYYSLMDPGSICVAVNPQTNLETYQTRQKPVENYLKYAWGDGKSIEEIGKQVVVNLPIAYTKGFDNMVIYLQSVGDLRHYGSQMPPFAQAALEQPKQFILNSGYWGVPDHSNSVPSKDYYPWVKAVVAAPWFDRQAILETHHDMIGVRSSPVSNPESSPRNMVTSPSDIRFADLLRDHQLRQQTGG